MMYSDTKNISILVFLLVFLIKIEIHSRCEIHKLNSSLYFVFVTFKLKWMRWVRIFKNKIWPQIPNNKLWLKLAYSDDSCTWHLLSIYVYRFNYAYFLLFMCHNVMFLAPFFLGCQISPPPVHSSFFFSIYFWSINFYHVSMLF